MCVHVRRASFGGAQASTEVNSGWSTAASKTITDTEGGAATLTLTEGGAAPPMCPTLGLHTHTHTHTQARRQEPVQLTSVREGQHGSGWFSGEGRGCRCFGWSRQHIPSHARMYNMKANEV